VLFFLFLLAGYGLVFIIVSRFKWFWNRFGTSKIMTDAVIEATEYSRTCEPRYDERYCPHCDYFTRQSDRGFCLRHNMFL